MKIRVMLMATTVAVIALGSRMVSAVPVPYGTYLVKGSFKGDYNTVLRAGVDAKVRTMRVDGSVISESPITAANVEGVNFHLEIPVASERTSSACTVGEMLDCALIVPEQGTLVVPNCLKVDSPLKVGLISVNYTDVKAFTNANDGTVVEIPISYLEEVQAYLDDFKPGEQYDPWGNYDNDGSSNFEEFRNGTNPFDASDCLRVRAFGPKSGKLALKFEHVGGHVYAVSSANTLEKPAWAKRRMRKQSDGDELDQVLAEGGDGEPGMTEIYITPVADAASEFFKLEGK